MTAKLRPTGLRVTYEGLRRERLAREIGLVELARDIGLGEHAILHMEQGRRDMTVPEMYKIAKRLGRPITRLVEVIDE